MGFEYQQRPGSRPGTGLIDTYTDDAIDSIYKTKAALKIDVERELETLKNLKKQLEDEYDAAVKVRDAITDWDSPEAEEAEEKCDDIYCKISVIDDHIDSLEDLNNVL